MRALQGVFTALVTPFAGGQIDLASLRKLVEFQLRNGVRGFVIAGTTGESPTLSLQERELIFSAAKEVSAGAATLVMGTGSNDTRQSIEWTRHAEKLNAAAALVVVPYYNKPPQRGLISHFQAIADSSSLPVLLYNVPGRTVTALELETIAELSSYPCIVGIKEASGDLEFGKNILLHSKPGFLLTSGDDITAFSLMEKGAKGVISVASHIMPKQFVDWSERATTKSIEAEYKPWHRLVNGLFMEANPIPVKMALFKMGIIASPELRLPLATLSPNLTTDLEEMLKERGLIQ